MNAPRSNKCNRVLVLVFLPCALLAIPAAALADEISVGAEAQDVEATHDEIRSLRDDLIAAINGRDTDALLPLLHADVILTAQAGSRLETIRGHEGIREYMNALLIGDDAGVRELTLNPTVDELTILHGDDTGIAYGESTDHYVLRNSSEFVLKTRWSSTIVKDSDGWKVAALHISSNLFDNPVLNGQERILKIAAAVLGILGLMLGKRRKPVATETA